MNNGIIKYSTAALTAMLLALTGCGGSGSDGESSSSSSVASSSRSSSSSVVTDNWELMWSDEFEGETIDAEKWGFEVNCAGGGNNELQCYTACEDNARVSDGKLHIIAKEESYAGPSMFDDDPNYDPRGYLGPTQLYLGAAAPALRSNRNGRQAPEAGPSGQKPLFGL